MYVQPIGGWDPQSCWSGRRLTVWTEGGPIFGVIARKPIHLLTDEERKQVPKIKDLWLDIGAHDKAEAAELVSVGDPVTVATWDSLRCAIDWPARPRMDDKAGLWVAIEALRRTGQEAELRAVRRFDRAGRDRAAGSHHQHVHGRPARGHRRRRDARHGLPHD